MDSQKFGDSYDFVKRDIIHWLASAEEWATHPMYSVRNVVSLPSTPSSWVLLSLRETQSAGIWHSTVGSDCPHHLLLDPNTGLRAGHEGPTDSLWDHVTIEEI